ncbi:MAG TPA: NACHT domain-containing protein [Solirubrobacteraceae bacterium]|jgi:hypothetical protein|nr:NACHT domain-containing protein [Solirubrobacteraceae bacterium]
MRKRAPRKLIWLTGACAISAFAASIAGWQLLGDRSIGIPLVVAALVAVFVMVGQPLLGEWLTARRADALDDPIDKDALLRWQEALRIAILERRAREGSQLDDALGAEELVAMRASGLVMPAADNGNRIRIDGATRAWTDVVSDPDLSTTRVVVLGDRGYGKTVAMLTLVKAINARDGQGGRLVELFALSEWFRWRQVYPREPLSIWLRDELVRAYPKVMPDIAQAIIDHDLLLPVLDGLDEVPAGHRLECRTAIDAYAGRVPPYRPFLVTSRAREYAELLPDGVSADRYIALLGLDPEQVERLLRSRPGWVQVAEQLRAGDAELRSVLRSPLRFCIALRVEDMVAPSALVGLERQEAESLLWEGVLRRGADDYRGASPAIQRRWLSAIANGMARSDRQHFWLHDVARIAPTPCVNPTLFRGTLAAALTLGLSVVLYPVTHSSSSHFVTNAFWAVVASALFVSVLGHEIGNERLRDAAPLAKRMRRLRPDILAYAGLLGALALLFGVLAGIGAAVGGSWEVAIVFGGRWVRDPLLVGILLATLVFVPFFLMGVVIMFFARAIPLRMNSLAVSSWPRPTLCCVRVEMKGCWLESPRRLSLRCRRR